MEEVTAGVTMNATMANAMDTNPPVPKMISRRTWESVGAIMDGEGPTAALSNVVMSTHVANMANVAMTSVNVTTAGQVMIAMTKLSTM